MSSHPLSESYSIANALSLPLKTSVQDSQKYEEQVWLALPSCEHLLRLTIEELLGVSMV